MHDGRHVHSSWRAWWFLFTSNKNTAHSCSFCRCDSSPMWIGCPCQFPVEHVFHFPCEANDPFLRKLGMHGFCLCRVCDGNSSVTAENLSLSQIKKWSNRATTDKVLVVWVGAWAFFSLKVEWGEGLLAVLLALNCIIYYSVEFNRSTLLKHIWVAEHLTDVPDAPYGVIGAALPKHSGVGGRSTDGNYGETWCIV